MYEEALHILVVFACSCHEPVRGWSCETFHCFSCSRIPMWDFPMQCRSCISRCRSCILPYHFRGVMAEHCLCTTGDHWPSPVCSAEQGHICTSFIAPFRAPLLACENFHWGPVQRAKLAGAEKEISRLNGRHLDNLNTRDLHELAGTLKRGLEQVDRIMDLRYRGETTAAVVN